MPHGGDGGKGGSVIFRSDPNAPPLKNFRYKQVLIAQSGTHGGSSKKRGRNGEDLIVLVPEGTRIFDRKRNLMIRDLMKRGEEVIVAQGGRGGVGNQGKKEATQGEKGVCLELDLKIRIPADVFLVGLPNSGKSKFLNAVTRTRLKEESYPFATTSPQMAVFEFSDYEQVTLCELPSIYRGSHRGRGLGVEFLKHLETAKLILVVLDPISEFAGSLQEGFTVLRDEIKRFDENLLKIPYAVLVTKMDSPEARGRVEKEGTLKAEGPVFYISSTSGAGLKEVGEFLKEKVALHA